MRCLVVCVLIGVIGVLGGGTTAFRSLAFDSAAVAGTFAVSAVLCSGSQGSVSVESHRSSDDEDVAGRRAAEAGPQELVGGYRDRQTDKQADIHTYRQTQR